MINMASMRVSRNSNIVAVWVVGYTMIKENSKPIPPRTACVNPPPAACTGPEKRGRHVQIDPAIRPGVPDNDNVLSIYHRGLIIVHHAKTTSVSSEE
jgi:hypothetical protein